MYMFANIKIYYIILFFQSSPNNFKVNQITYIIPYMSILYILMILSKSQDQFRTKQIKRYINYAILSWFQ